MHLNIITLLPLFVALASSANGYYADEFDARDYVDGLSTREINQELQRREIITELAEFSSRDLLDAISIQLDRRIGPKRGVASNPASRWGDNPVIDPEKSHPVHKPTCYYCNKEYTSQADATACGNTHTKRR